ncbi:hypothetical protein QQF64_036064 [Cirrhinus molitorella]|uniref:CxC3 like cysteine cluster domain-containing protein n=1 Tax=Cirrhinus molitorella TaxID=172907 RepID=A0ABR3NIB0_9TELE
MTSLTRISSPVRLKLTLLNSIMLRANKNKLEAVLLLGDAFVEEIQKRNTESQTQEPEVSGQCKVTWWKRDRDGQRITTSKRRKKGSSADFNMQRLEDMLQDSESIDGQEIAQQPPLSSWCQRQKEVQQCWQQARPQILANLLSAENIIQRTCNHCHVRETVIRCMECLPSEWFCAECDQLVHKRHTLHNRQTTMYGFYKYISPTDFVKLHDDKYIICGQDCLLPTAFPQIICSCDRGDVVISVGKSIILVCINGRYNLRVPVLTCKHCNKQWAPEVSDFVTSGYWPATMQAQTLFHQDLFHSFEAMKTAAPGMSVKAFTAMLDQRTKQFGRTGKVSADAFQRSFLQYVYCNSELNQLLGKEPFVCPACSPEMVAVSVDGNRKLYRFKKTNQSEEPGFFDGVFLAQDSEVSKFVEEIRAAVKSTAGKAMCGESHWTAAREMSKQANKLDEEGVEIAVCRHGFLLKGLNMYRGEIFAYPMFLQKEFQGATFLAMDVTCRYVPYLQKVSEALTHLQPLQKMRHCLSVMHAKAHNTKCEILWNARNQEGAGTTLGEEVEQVNSFLSRCALTTKYMAKSVRTDMLTVYAIGWNQRKDNGLHIALSSRFKKTVEKTAEVTTSLKKMQEQLHCSDDMLKQWIVDVKQWANSGNAATTPVDARGLQISIEALFVSICQKKHYLYRQNDRNKRRQKISQKIAQEKKRLLEEIQRYNQQPDGDPVDTNSVVQKLSNKAAESMIWPWQEQNAEEKQILVKEMMQHCQYLKDSVAKVQSLMETVSVCTQTGSCPNGFTEEGSKGLISLLKRRLQDLRLKQQTVACSYRGILEPTPRLVEVEEGEMEEEMDWQHDISSEDEDEDDDDEDDDAEVGT